MAEEIELDGLLIWKADVAAAVIWECGGRWWWAATLSLWYGSVSHVDAGASLTVEASPPMATFQRVKYGHTSYFQI